MGTHFEAAQRDITKDFVERYGPTVERVAPTLGGRRASGIERVGGLNTRRKDVLKD
jgi:hypothetical protein